MAISCICRSSLRRERFSKNFDLLKCPTCGSGKFVDRGGSGLVDYVYDSADDKYGNEAYLNRPEFRWAHMTLLQQDWAGRRILEIGCFTGFFMDALRRKGADVTGVEVNGRAAETGMTIYGLQGRIFPALEKLPATSQFDDILMIDVLEHIELPETFLGELLPLLAPGGSIVISSPTVERRFHDKSDFPPHHHWWFSRVGLQKLVADAGLTFEREAIQYDGMLLLRNFLGRIVSGFSKREFYGDGSPAVSAIARAQDKTAVYRAGTKVGQVVLRAFGIQYCSYLLRAANRRQTS